MTIPTLKAKCPQCEFIGDASEMQKHFGYNPKWHIPDLELKSAHPHTSPPAWTYEDRVQEPDNWCDYEL